LYAPPAFQRQRDKPDAIEAMRATPPMQPERYADQPARRRDDFVSTFHAIFLSANIRHQRKLGSAVRHATLA
jgi:hypothetical protein